MVATTTSTHPRRWWLLGIALLAVSVAGFSHVVNVSLRGQHPESETDADRNPGRTIGTFGHVDSALGVRKMHPIQPGRVAEVLVREGDVVAANAVLLRMEDGLARARAEEARVAHESATVDLAEARLKSPEKHRLDLQKQELAITLARHKRDGAELAYKHKQKLAAGKVGVSETDVELAKAEFEAAQTLVQVEEANLKQLQLLDPAIDIRRLEAKANQSKSLHDQAQAALAEYVIKAPRAGSVLRISCSPGDTLGPNPQQAAIEFCPDGPRFIRAEVEQAYAAAVAVGQKVVIDDSTNAPGRWTGRVERVSDWFARKRSVIFEPDQYNDVRTLECIIALDPGQPELRINQRVLVTIQVGAR